MFYYSHLFWNILHNKNDVKLFTRKYKWNTRNNKDYDYIWILPRFIFIYLLNCPSLFLSLISTIRMVNINQKYDQDSRLSKLNQKDWSCNHCREKSVDFLWFTLRDSRWRLRQIINIYYRNIPFLHKAFFTQVLIMTLLIWRKR